MNLVALSCQGPEMDTDSLVTSLLRLFVRLLAPVILGRLSSPMYLLFKRLLCWCS